MKTLYELMNDYLNENKQLPFSDIDTESDYKDEIRYIQEYHEEDDVTEIQVLNRNNEKVGYIIYENLFEPMEYELKDFISDKEFDDIYNDSDNIIKISYLVVNKKYRGKGIATKLMNMVLKDTKKEGYKDYYLNASPMDEYTGLDMLISFYKSFGFKTFKHQGVNALMYKV